MDNARKHMHNAPRWAVQMDVADAYPSTSAERVHANLEASLSKKISGDLAHYSGGVQKKVVDALVTLLIYNDQLPQGTPTSMRLMNIVMWNTDRQISGDLMDRKHGILHAPIYTRYVDDLVLSWKEFGDMNEVWKGRKTVKNEIDDLVNVHADIRNGLLGRVKIAYRYEEFITSIEHILRKIESL